MVEHTLSLLIPKEKIEVRVKELAWLISSDYAGRRPVILGVLKGSFMFLADLLRHLTVDPLVDFIAVSSYRNGTTSSGRCFLTKNISCDICHKDVLLVEDIVDTGTTFRFLIGHIRDHAPSSLKICTLLDKPSRRAHAIPIDYCGFTISDDFVVGYGLDCDEQYRSLPGIYILKKQ
ncbi:MAG: hypoxanthine phosphoribosyltransferase [Desulfobacterota bacterium]|nr:hypoxanthine phosphoribosyltransferase [Thermodesulfobacteriota bacterium]